LATHLYLTLGEIDLAFTAVTKMRLVELIREDFLFGSTVGTAAHKCFQVLESLEARAMSGGGHP